MKKMNIDLKIKMMTIIHDILKEQIKYFDSCIFKTHIKILIKVSKKELIRLKKYK
jgi:hypothetical protein